MDSEAPLLSQITTAILILDLNGRFFYLNNSAERAVGITARNLIGKRFNYFIEAESLPVREWLSQLSHLETKIYDKRLLQFKNQQSVDAELVLQKILLANDYYLLIEWQNSSLVKRHKQEEEILRQQQIQQQLLNNLAHEIKTPLTGIAGAAQLINPEPKDNLEISNVISKEVKRLTQLVNRMLLGQQVASRLRVNIHEIIEDVIRFLSLNLPPNITIVRDYDPSLPELELAPEQIYQVVLNLAQNSVDALVETNNPKLTFKTRIKKEHPLAPEVNLAVCISIIDNGCGIPEALKPSIFFPMISGKNSSGLGLGIAQGLLQQHQGTIEVDSKNGLTQFRCYLPLNSDHSNG
ncbi:nitrogen regulation protein NR(II) [Kangiella sp. HZ709]|uniref:two-component system sensor histidine kinase NtrB n=1 Tax=Kangiella sp. HZ709 TaxID=2666328 RepID=UPI0012B12F3A|nr:ATP-binding protein [Kangiella sp. HZ709]MRX28240.1 PAS domain-containing protein [Kangiella sp. HZ709]